MEHNRCTIFYIVKFKHTDSQQGLISAFNLLNYSVKTTTYIYLEIDRKGLIRVQGRKKELVNTYIVTQIYNKLQQHSSYIRP